MSSSKTAERTTSQLRIAICAVKSNFTLLHLHTRGNEHLLFYFSSSLFKPHILFRPLFHQEWLWPVGYYLRARLHFARDKEDEARNIKKILSRHFIHIETNSWMGLPELTNSNGSYCRDSCSIQAWSISTLLDVLFDLHECSNCVSST